MEENQIPTSNPTVPESVSFPGAMPPAKKKSNKWIYIVIVFVIIIGVIAFLVFKGSQAGSEEATTEPTDLATPSQTVEPTPTATPASVTKDEIKIQVLNGTGIAGEAAYLVNQLKPLGYTSTTTGNSDTSSATATKVTFATKISSDVVTEITSQLKSIYQSVETDTSSSLTSTDIQIITGLRKGATANPSSTPTPTPAQ
ncbi:MAG TPA: LytR C-terminal domain-containing protein [Patescibacteria group bacterium]